MPKARVEREVHNDGKFRTVEVEVGERGITKTARYTVPCTPTVFRDMVLEASESPDGGEFVKWALGPDRKDQNESPLAFIHRFYVSAVDKAARADVYESVAAESTVITVGKDKKDIMEFPIDRLVMAVNGMRSQRSIRLLTVDESDEDAIKAVERGLGFGPWKTAAKKLTEGWMDKDNVKHNPAAVENLKSGMLELIDA